MGQDRAGVSPSLHARDILSSWSVYPEQVAQIMRLSPWTLCANLVIICCVVFSFWGTEHPQSALYWALPGLALTLFSLVQVIGPFSKTFDFASSAPRLARTLTAFAAIRGLHWGAGMCMLLPIAAPDQKLLLGWVLVGMICGGNFAYWSLPSAAFAYVCSLALGGVVAFGIEHGSVLNTNSFMLVVFSVFLLWSSVNNTQNLRARLEGDRQQREQGEIVSLLLKDFEETAADWLWTTDGNGRIVHGRERLAGALALPVEDLVVDTLLGHLAKRCLRPEQGQSLQGLERLMQEGRPFRDALVTFMQSGDEVFWQISAKPVMENDGLVGWRGVVSDVTAATMAQRKIAHMALHDNLTGLPNRTRFQQRLCQLYVGDPAELAEHAVFYADLDGFKSVNDTLGHHVGDRLLQSVVRRITFVLPSGSMLCRLGGDEFALLLRAGSNPVGLERVASALVRALAEPFEIDGHLVATGVSIGIARCGLDGADMNEVMRNADLALYRAKSEGRATWRLFDLTMDMRHRERRDMENALRQAVTRHELKLHYQPIVSLADRSILGYEALLRWHDAERGDVPPDQFIRLAEECGLISNIGEWVLREVCQHARQWPSHLRIALNVSPVQVRSPRFLAAVTSALARNGIAPSRLEFEISENALTAKVDQTVAAIKQLRSLGVRVVLDDLGSGKSSLRFLRERIFDRIKFDEELVSGCAHDRESAAVLKSLLRVSTELGITSIAEAVETEEQLVFLLANGCGEAQGYLLGSPQPEESLPHTALRQSA
jgi:diguanylate cyclase (GGDEF)-like protein